MRVEYKTIQHAPGNIDDILRNECFMKNYANALKSVMGKPNQKTMFAYHDIEHKSGLVFSTYKCTHYKLNCDTGDLQSKEVNEPCNSPNPFIFDKKPIRQIGNIDKTDDFQQFLLGDNLERHDDEL